VKYKQNTKKPLIFIMLITIAALAVVFLAFNSAAPPPDLVLINDALWTAAESENHAESANILAEKINEAFLDMDKARVNRDRNLRLLLYIVIIVLAIAGISLYLYCEKNILSPFRSLKHFTRRIAAGNLDIPLEMDKNNLFGAFTESFDIMREELKKARENERIADRSKKELVASLSHDIKTPIASIKAVTELMLVVAQNESRENEIKQLEIINAKAEQINSLITNIFHSTLHELQELSVTNAEAPSTAIINIINNADFEKRVKPFFIPSCLIVADLLRLQQVFDNIFANSYKYAGTDIDIKASISENSLIIEVMDFGAGVAQDELPLIMNKFFRGKNTETKSGYGLGLYIAKNLLAQMGGDIQCENHADGFVVRIVIRLAG